MSFTRLNQVDIYIADWSVSPPDVFHLPVNPIENIVIGTEKKYETVDLLNYGEVDTPGGEKIRQIEFNSFFPAEYDPSYCRYPNIPDPLEAYEKLTRLTIRKEPVRLIITGTNINMMVSLAANQITHKGGEPGDIYYSLTCRSWREIKITSTTKDAQSSNRTDIKPKPKVYVVKSGDNLTKIAKRELGSSSRWQDIYSVPENKKTIGPNPNKIKPGQRLVMP